MLVRVILTNAFGFVGDSWWGNGSADEGGTSAAFQIRGDATAPMSPGVAVPIMLKFSNPHSEPMTVSHLHVTIRELTTSQADADHPCTMDDFVVTQIKGSPSMTVPAGSTAGFESLQIPQHEWPKIGMLNRPVDQDGCRGAKLKLGYTAFGNLGS